MPKISIQGKRTLFFSRNYADKSWRLKEKIVAVIESFFQDRDNVLTFSSINIRDVVNDLENVDVVYANMEDPRELFSFVEVRDRGEKVGRQYIQEIMGKRESLGIENCRIVSTKGFSRNAIRLASHKGIDLRVLYPDTEANRKRWFNPDFIQMRYPIVQLIKCLVVMKENELEHMCEFGYASEDGDPFSFSRKEELRAFKKILIPLRNSNKYQLITPVMLLNREFNLNVEKKRRVFDSVPADGKFHPVNISLKVKPGELYLLANEMFSEKVVDNQDLLLDIISIEFQFLINSRPIFADIDSQFKYLDAATGEKIGEIVLATFGQKKVQHYFIFVRHKGNKNIYKLGAALFR